MTVIGLDDTDSHVLRICTTYLATLVTEAIEARGGTIERRLLARLNPAVEHKTRGNAALVIHTDLPAGAAFDLTHEELDRWTVLDDDRTSPGVVVASGSPDTTSTAVAGFARDAVRDFHDLGDAVALAERPGFLTEGWHGGRSRVGALTAVDVWAVFDGWTYEHISYREFHRYGTSHEVDVDSIFDAADATYPGARDTVDREEGEGVCVSDTPGPILHGIHSDGANTIREVATAIDSRPVDRSAAFRTSQGTDAHLRDGVVSDLHSGHTYHIADTVTSDPETRRGGRILFDLKAGDAMVTVAAFEPTKRFRNRVRALRVGDAITVYGGVGDGTFKLEKFAVRDLVRTEPAMPVYPDCGRTMKSMGQNQGYRCRDCGTDAPGKVEWAVDRNLEPG